MTKDEALQMCLEYIETNAHERRCVRWAIKDALAKPTSGYAKKIEELIKERDALRALVQDETAIRAGEREACEALCKWRTGIQQVDAAIETCEAAIRARGNT